jgi:hypothetical protein
VLYILLNDRLVIQPRVIAVEEAITFHQEIHPYGLAGEILATAKS